MVAAEVLPIASIRVKTRSKQVALVKMDTLARASCLATLTRGHTYIMLTSFHSVAFAEADLNDDRKITFGEWVLSQAVEGGRPMALTKHWIKFDWEEKGYLTFQEAYERKFGPNASKCTQS
jgi:hypothetical protein